MDQKEFGGKMIEIELDDLPEGDARTLIEKISDEVLANPVIESFRVELP
mgnify:CR=1 FL=1